MNALRAAVLVVGGVLATVAAAARWQPADGAAAPGAPEALGPVLTGRVVDENGAAVPGVKIQLYSGLATRWEGQSTTTDADGVYRFEPLEIGSMGWRGEGENREAFYYVGVRIEHPTMVSNERCAWWDLEVPIRDGHVEVRDFAMVPGGRLAGQIRTPHGSGWGGIDLRLVPLDPSHRNSTGWYATTDHRGRFATEVALTPGPYAIQWNSPAAGYPELARVEIRPGEATRATIDMKVSVEASSQSEMAPIEAP